MLGCVHFGGDTHLCMMYFALQVLPYQLGCVNCAGVVLYTFVIDVLCTAPIHIYD